MYYIYPGIYLAADLPIWLYCCTCLFEVLRLHTSTSKQQIWFLPQPLCFTTIQTFLLSSSLGGACGLKETKHLEGFMETKEL